MKRKGGLHFAIPQWLTKLLCLDRPTGLCGRDLTDWASCQHGISVTNSPRVTIYHADKCVLSNYPQSWLRSRTYSQMNTHRCDHPPRLRYLQFSDSLSPRSAMHASFVTEQEFIQMVQLSNVGCVRECRKESLIHIFHIQIA